MTRRERLAELMEERRLDLKLTWREVAVAAGITTETLRQVRFGTAQIQKLTQRGVEDALAWQPGAIASFLAGGDPPSAASTAVPEMDRVCVLLYGMTAQDLYRTVVSNKAIAIGDRIAFVRAVGSTVPMSRPSAGDEFT